MRLLARCYLNNSVLPATREHAADWQPDRHSVDRVLKGYQEGDSLVAAESELAVDSASEDALFEACDKLFSFLNRDDRPNGETERSMSVGDLARVQTPTETVWFSCEILGWKRVSAPAPESIQ